MSFFSDIATKLTRPKQVFGIHINHNDETTSYRLVALQRKKNTVVLLKKETFSSLEELIKELPAGSSLGVRYTGKGILSRELNEEIAADRLLTKLLPNADPSEFHLQHFTYHATQYASLIRKDVLQGTLSHFSTHFVTSIELGEGAEKTLYEVLDLPNTPEQTVTIGNQPLEFEFTPAFSAAFKALLDLEEGTLNLEHTHFAKDDYTQKQLFQLGGVTLLGLSLILLLSNFILFQNYRNANAELSEEAAKYEQVNAKEDSLSNVLNQREEFLSKSGWMKNRYLSKELDLLAATLPKELLLDEITFFPIDEKATREKRKNQYQANTVIIEGTTSNAVYLNQWVNDINDMKSFSATEIVEYEYDSRNRVGLFTLAIQTE